jgi:hypothetical protein
MIILEVTLILERHKEDIDLSSTILLVALLYLLSKLLIIQLFKQ